MVEYLDNILSKKLIYRSIFEINLLEEIRRGTEGLVRDGWMLQLARMPFWEVTKPACLVA